MRPTITSEVFPDEDAWPFVGRRTEFDRCLSFLSPFGTDAPSRLLRIAGESGSGKSFFCKELVCRFTERAPSAIALYVNVEESQFESSELEKRLALIASYPAEPTRRDPQHIPVNSDLASYLRPRPSWMNALRYTYKGLREATSEVPIWGKPIKALLPPELPQATRRELAAAGRFWDYLIFAARRDPVLLVLDNFQFLPDSVAIEIDAVLALSEIGFRLVIVDRLREGVSESWKLRCFSDNRLAAELTSLTKDDTRKIAGAVLGSSATNVDEISDVIFRKSGGNPKQIWLQLRTFRLQSQAFATKSKNFSQRPSESVIGTYEETIQSLPVLDRLTLQLVTLLMGGLKVDDVIGILRGIANAFSEEEIRRAILDLALVGLVIVNGSQNNRIRTEHELVTRSVRRITSESEVIELRQDVVSALAHRLDGALDDAEYERLVDRLIGLVSPEDLRRRHDLLAHLISLIDKQNSRERFHYLSSLFGAPCCQDVLDILPPHSLEAFLDAFQKTSQFNKGLAAIELMRPTGKIPKRTLNIYGAKYLVQKFEYGEAEKLLHEIDRGSDRDVVLFNVLLNLCRDDEARKVVDGILKQKRPLDEFQCVILRNSSHLYDETAARNVLERAAGGFRNLGLKFGEATTWNNKGVLELWAGNRGAALKALEQSKLILEALGSNEIYQPLTNLAIHDAVEGDMKAARRNLDLASVSVSPWLKMDSTMLSFNRLVFDLMEGSANSDKAIELANRLHRESLELKDLRFQDVLAWFVNQLEVVFLGSSSIPIPEGFESRIQHSRLTGLEIFSHTNVEDKTVPTVLVLSPHWRY